jgi:hypothetical protein
LLEAAPNPDRGGFRKAICFSQENRIMRDKTVIELDELESDQLDDKTLSTLEELIDQSVVARYDSLLDRGEGRRGEISYRPMDTDRLCDLLVELWDELLTPEAINEAFDRLVVEWRDEWPHGVCEADEAERPLSDYGPD